MRSSCCGVFGDNWNPRCISFRQAALPAPLTLAPQSGVVLHPPPCFGVAGAFAARLQLAGRRCCWVRFVASTDADRAVFFLLRHRRHQPSATRSARRWKSMIGKPHDPMAIFFSHRGAGRHRWPAKQGSTAPGVDLHPVFRQTDRPLAWWLGLAGGFLLIVQIIGRIPVERGLAPHLRAWRWRSWFSPITSAIGGSGFLAVYVAGILCRQTRRYGPRHRSSAYQEGMTWLAQIIHVPRTWPACNAFAVPAESCCRRCALAIFLVFVARPLAVWLCPAAVQLHAARNRLRGPWVRLCAGGRLLSCWPCAAHSRQSRERATLFQHHIHRGDGLRSPSRAWTVKPIARRLGVDRPAAESVPSTSLSLMLPGTRQS